MTVDGYRSNPHIVVILANNGRSAVFFIGNRGNVYIIKTKIVTKGHSKSRYIKKCICGFGGNSVPYQDVNLITLWYLWPFIFMFVPYFSLYRASTFLRSYYVQSRSNVAVPTMCTLHCVHRYRYRNRTQCAHILNLSSRSVLMYRLFGHFNDHISHYVIRISCSIVIVSAKKIATQRTIQLNGTLSNYYYC